LPETQQPDGRHQADTPLTRAAKRSSGRIIGVAAMAFLAAAGVAAAGILSRRQQDSEVMKWTEEQAIPTVATITPKQGVIGQHLVLPGDIEAWYEAPIFARVNGYLKNWYFDFGAHVQKGQLLADIDAPDLDAQLAAAKAKFAASQAQVKVQEAQRDFANTTYARWRDSPKGVVSEQEKEGKKADFNSAGARYIAAQADANADQGAVDQLAALEAFKRIVAPFDGVVTSRNTDVGALINAGSGSNGPQLFRVADVHEMRVFVQVPQEMSAGMHGGLTADLAVPQFPNRSFKAVVATTAEAISKPARTLLVELHVDNADGALQPGSFAEVHFDLPNAPDMVRIPASALIFQENGLQVALLGKDQKVELRPVTLGRNLGTDVEVVKGLSASDDVIDSPPDSLASGETVRQAQQ
jgi:RND family efflux transporter MFP subunit